MDGLSLFVLLIEVPIDDDVVVEYCSFALRVHLSEMELVVVSEAHLVVLYLEHLKYVRGLKLRLHLDEFLASNSS